MTGLTEGEHFIPLRVDELVDVLCEDPELSPQVQADFRQLCRLVTALYQFQYGQHLDRLKAAYAPFDPDAEAVPLARISAAEKQQRENALFNEFATALEAADFKHLARNDLEPALQGPGNSGLRMDVDFSVFERLAIFGRGETLQKRTRRLIRSGGRRREVQVPIYQRLVMIMKLRPHRRLGRQVHTDSVYLQLFKNIAKLDVHMLLPGARVRINQFDRGKIGFSLLSGLALTVWRILQEITNDIAQIFVFHHPAALWGIAAGAIGYGARSYFGYQQTRQRYNLSLTQILYFQNLDTNSGVLYRLVDEAKEQQCREAILSYYLLWRHADPQGWTAGELNEHGTLELQRRAGLKVNVAIGDDPARLEKLQIIERVGARYRAQPLNQALQTLAGAWGGNVKGDEGFGRGGRANVT